MDYLSEAFKQLEILNEDVFDLDKDGLEDLRDFQDEDEEEVIGVIDPDAEDEEELKDSYVGKVILDCSVCHTDIYKDKEDVIIDEETQLANVGEECPYCFSVDGFKVIGEVKPFVETEFETEDDVDVEVDGEEVEEDEDEEVDDEEVEKNESFKRHKKMIESISRRNRKSLTEAPVYSLEPRYDARKSFYGKAQVDTGDKGDKNKLYSYGTLVAEIKDGKPVVYGTYSATTLRHIKDWLKQNGFRADTSKQIVADYGVKNEACDGNRKPRKMKESKVPMMMSKKALKEGWRGTPVKIVSHGSWGDPDLVWNNGEEEYTFNYWDIEDAMWNMFLEETGHKDSESNDPKVEEEFNEYVQDNYEGYLEDVIWGGYFDEGSTNWHDRYRRESLKRKPARKTVKESVGQDVSEYQKWVDYDMKKYKKISKETMSKIKKAGLSVVKDQYGDYEVIADRKDESLKNRKPRKMKESIEDNEQDIIDIGRAILDDKRKGITSSGNWWELKLKGNYGSYDLDEIADDVTGGSFSGKTDSGIMWKLKIDNKLKESIEDITIDTGDQEITVSAVDKEKVESDDEMIAPLSDEVKTDIEMNTEEEENGDEVDVDMDEFSEEEFDDLGESYLKKVYENVDSYKTTSVSEKGNKLKVEGLIKFTSGKTKKTSFVFEAKTIDKNGHAKFLGENLQISRGHKSFKLSGTVSNNKFIAESLNYNYRAKNGKNSQRVYGTVKVNKK